MPISVIIVDDHQLIRDGFAGSIKENNCLVLAGEAVNAAEGLEKITKLKPDIAIIDIHLPEVNGIEFSGLELSKKIKNESPNTNIIILTSYPEEEYFIEAMEIGVSGYFYKDDSSDLIIDAISEIHNGDTVLSPKVHKYVANRYKARSDKENKNPDTSCLTPRELEILKLISQNKTSQEISKLLFIEKRTVETHRNNMRDKLALIGKGSNALLVFALKNNAYLNK